MKPFSLLLKTTPASPIVNICYFLSMKKKMNKQVGGKEYGRNSLVSSEEIRNPGDIWVTYAYEAEVKLLKKKI